MFIERSFSLAVRGGYSAMITMQSWMFLRSFEALRKEIVLRKAVVTLAHLGTGAFDSISGDVVAATSFVRATRAGCLEASSCGPPNEG
jgi:hypothetical protein